MHSAHFSVEELACKCGRPECDAAEVKQYALDGLEGVRKMVGRPMTLRSARRCPYWNFIKDGSDKSRHLICDAFDVEAYTGREKFLLIEAAICAGATGIGVGRTFVHMDWRRDQLGQHPSAWMYP